MDLGSLLRVLARRWLVLLIGVLLTLGVAGYVYLQTPSRYQSTARMLLLLPANARGEQAIGSPFLYLPNGLTVLARIVALTPTSRDFQVMMYQDGLTSQYEIGVDNQSPTLTISVEGTDPANVVATRDRLVQEMNEELLAIQREEGTPAPQIAHTRVYAAEANPTQIGGERFRGVIAAGGAGVLLTLILVFVIDRLSQLRAARRAARSGGQLPVRQTRRDRRQARAAAGAAVAAEQAHPASSPDPEATAVGHNAPTDEDLATRIRDAAYDPEADEASSAGSGERVADPDEDAVAEDDQDDLSALEAEAQAEADAALEAAEEADREDVPGPDDDDKPRRASGGVTAKV